MDEKIIKFLKKRHILSLSVACDASLLDFSDPAFSIAGLSDLGTDDTAATNATNAANAENAENIAATMGASSTANAANTAATNATNAENIAATMGASSTANAANTAATMGASSTAAAANAENTAATMGAFSTANAANAANIAATMGAFSTANAANAENTAATMGAFSTANAANAANIAATMGASSTAAAANAENIAATMGASSTANAANAANSAQIAIHTCSCFYAYCEPLNALVIASKPDTAHIKIALQNPQISLNIALDTKIIGRIEGIQARADFIQVTKLNEYEQKLCKRAYFVRFPYALALNPKLYALKLSWLKYTNNALKNKLIWQK